MAKVIDKTGRVAEIYEKILGRCVWQGDCLIWQGPTSGSGRGGGYPRMTLNGHTVAVHRVVATLLWGYLPRTVQVDHICNNRLCLNPSHLELVDHLENQRRRAERAKVSHTKGGENG